LQALESKHDTPKYGQLVHASTKLKGKVSSLSRVAVSNALPPQVSQILAAKASLATRVDALNEETNTDMGIEQKMV